MCPGCWQKARKNLLTIASLVKAENLKHILPKVERKIWRRHWNSHHVDVFPRTWLFIVFVPFEGLPGTERNPFFFTILFINLDFFILKLLSFTSSEMQPEVSGRIELLSERHMESCFDIRAFSFTGAWIAWKFYLWDGEGFASWHEMKDGVVAAWDGKWLQSCQNTLAVLQVLR